MLVDLGSDVYQEEFEKAFLGEAAEFYRVEAADFISSSNCPDYLRKAELRLAEEMERTNNYLDPSSEPKITRVWHLHIFTSHHTADSSIYSPIAEVVLILPLGYCLGLGPAVAMHCCISAVSYFLSACGLRDRSWSVSW